MRPSALPTRAVTALLLVAGVLLLVPPAGPDDRAGPAGQRPGRLRQVALSAADERIAFIGTGHRGLGVVTGSGDQATAAPFLAETPAHFDDDVSARGSAITWTSRRDAATPEVYLRTGAGQVTRVTANTSTEGHPVLSPDGTQVAFHSDAGRSDGGHDIYVVAVGGGTPRRLTDGVGDNTWPTWSPDATTVAFQGRRPAGPPQVYRVPAAGGAISQLVAFPDGAGEPAWDPDAAHNRIVFTLAPENHATRTIATLTLGSTTAQSLGSWDGHQASWSSDGTTLVFLSTTPPDGGDRDGLDRVYTGLLSPDLCTCELTMRLAEDREVGTPTWYTPPGGEGQLLVSRINAPDRRTATLQDVRRDGVDPRDLGLTVLREDPGVDSNPDLIYKPTNGDPWYGRPAYSPDGTRIAVTRFETIADRRTAQTWIVNADGSSPRLLPLAGRQPGGVDKAPAWSPDGTRIALSVQDPGGPFRVVVVNPGTGQRLVTVPGSDLEPSVSDLEPAWSADGSTLAFGRGDPDAANPASHVWLASAANGGDQRDLTAAICGDCAGDGRAVVDYAPAFSPDGTRIAFSRRDDGVIVTDLDGGDCQVLLPRTPVGAVGCALAATAGPAGPFSPRDVAWSPDGRSLAFSARAGADRTAKECIEVFDLGTSTVRELTSGLPGRQKYPTWQRAVDVSTSLVQPPAPTTVGNGTTFTLEVRSNGPDPAMRTGLALTVPNGLELTGLVPQAGSCVVASAHCDLGRIEPGGAVRVQVELTGLVPGTYTVSWVVDGGIADANPPDNRAETSVQVGPPPQGSPASPRITTVVNPAPGYVGGSVTVTYTVRNAGGVASEQTTVRPQLPAGVPVVSLPAQCPTVEACPLSNVPPGGSVTLAFGLAPNTAVNTTVTGTVTMAGAGSASATAPFVVLQPKIVPIPPLGPPGFVASIRGTDFPPGVPVRLSWSVGVTVAANPAVPRADGTFAAQLLVLNKDQLGPRKVTATGQGFAPVSADFLVVVPAQQPPSLVQRR